MWNSSKVAAALFSSPYMEAKTMRSFVFTDEKSNKFWNIELQGTSFTVTFGRVGTKGQTQTKKFTTDAKAKTEHDKLVAEKLKKGYVETTPGATAPPPAVSLERRALEAALAENPDSIAAHSAYADYLMEQNDPRGELIQVQLALEDASKPKKERDTLRKREAALLKKHASEWIGDAGRFLVGKWSGANKPYEFRFARGWLDFVRTLPMPETVIVSLARSPESRLLRHLEVVYDMQYHPFDFDQFTKPLAEKLRPSERSGEEYAAYASLLLLSESQHLTNLRVFKYGFSDEGDRLVHSTMVDPFGNRTAQNMLDLLKKNSRLEELYLNSDLPDIATLFASPLLGNLRVFQYYYGTNYHSYGQNQSDPYPLSTLAKNKALKNLTTLSFHPGRDARIDIDELNALLRSKHLPALAHLQVHMTTFGNEGADRIVASGILKRLKTLDIAYGTMTDEGAATLAACPDLKKLEVLNVMHNAMTETGSDDLRATGVQLLDSEQHDEYDTDHLSEVDVE
jgi:uncharacterized protein (TIGR02996 family)